MYMSARHPGGNGTRLTYGESYDQETEPDFQIKTRML